MFDSSRLLSGLLQHRDYTIRHGTLPSPAEENA